LKSLSVVRGCTTEQALRDRSELVQLVGSWKLVNIRTREFSKGMSRAVDLRLRRARGLLWGGRCACSLVVRLHLFAHLLFSLRERCQLPVLGLSLHLLNKFGSIHSCNGNSSLILTVGVLGAVAAFKCLFVTRRQESCTGEVLDRNIRFKDVLADALPLAHGEADTLDAEFAMAVEIKLRWSLTTLSAYTSLFKKWTRTCKAAAPLLIVVDDGSEENSTHGFNLLRGGRFLSAEHA
jgi:hypothetical protein